MVHKDSDIKELSEVNGKKSATLPGTFGPLWIDAALQTVDLTKDNVEIQGMAPKLQLAALESKQVDVLFTVEPACSFGVNKGIGKIIYEEPLRHLGSSLTASVISSELDPKTAKKIVKGTDKAIDFIRENPEESLAIMAEYTGYKPELIEGMKVPVYSKSTEISEESLQELADKLFIENDLETRIDVGGLIFK